jgi:NADH:ubiquinone oxidoreductase subunit H
VSLLLWSILPLSAAGALWNGEVGLLMVLGLSSLGSYGVIYAGWASNNKYALLGAFRAVAQFISYEIILSLLFLPLISATATLSLQGLVTYQAEEGWFVYLLPLEFMAFGVVLAETNRTPFDLPEAEAELVAGFNVEYSSLLFAFFFLAEYSAMGFFAALLATLFLGGWSLVPWGTNTKPHCLMPASIDAEGELLTTLARNSDQAALLAEVVGSYWRRALPMVWDLGTVGLGLLVLVLKIQLLCAAFVLVRASLPRLRFDQLLLLCWQYLFPLALTLVLAVVALQYSALLWALAPPPSKGELELFDFTLSWEDSDSWEGVTALAGLSFLPLMPSVSTISNLPRAIPATLTTASMEALLLEPATPLEQFELLPMAAAAGGAIGTNIGGLLFAYAAFALGIGALLLVAPRLVGGGWLQTSVEVGVRSLGNFADANGGRAQQGHRPLLLVLALVLTLSNVGGLLPYALTPTAHLVCTFLYAFGVFFGLN